MHEFITIELESGKTIRVLRNQIPQESDVSDDDARGKFSKILPVIKEISGDFLSIMKEMKPSKASIQFGIDIGIESSGIVALITKANAQTNFQIVLEWEPESSKQTGSKS